MSQTVPHVEEDKEDIPLPADKRKHKSMELNIQAAKDLDEQFTG